MPSEKRFKDYDWNRMARAIGFEMVEDKGDYVIIRRPNEYDTRYMLSENGGELNITKITYEPVGDNSVPYSHNRWPGGAVGPFTLATWVAQWIDVWQVTPESYIQPSPANVVVVSFPCPVCNGSGRVVRGSGGDRIGCWMDRCPECSMRETEAKLEQIFAAQKTGETT